MGGPDRAVSIVPATSSTVVDQYPSLQGELILEMTYGYEAQGRNDKMIEAAKRGTNIAAETTLPSDLLINGLPYCLCFMPRAMY